MRAFAAIVIAGLLGLACVDRLPIAGAACPCPAPSFCCDPTQNICVPAGSAICQGAADAPGSAGSMPASSGRAGGNGQKAGTSGELGDGAAGASGAGGSTPDAGPNSACPHPCGPCHVCSPLGTCEIDPLSNWNITCVSAVVSPTKANGQAWDAFGEPRGGPGPDPFCQFQTNKDTLDQAHDGVSATIDDTTMPTWNDLVTPVPVLAKTLLSASAYWMLWIGDDDGATAEPICHIYPPLSANALESGHAQFANIEYCSSVTLKLDCVTAP
jgi:hypothetical protein